MFRFAQHAATLDASLLGGQVVAYRPFEPTAQGASWFAEHGDDVPLVVGVTLWADGEPVESAALPFPWLGQLLVVAQATAP